MYLKINYKNIKVSFSWHLNGGGIIFAHEFVRIVSKKAGKAEHIFEYCAGPGFIGFCLLAHGLCDRLTLADINPKAIEAIKDTIKNNNLQDKVTVYQSDCLDAIPKNQQWDLVVGNPPWHLSSKDKKNIMVCDPGSRVHEKFYRDIGQFLKTNGSVLFIEGGEYTNMAHFIDMVENNGLKMRGAFRVRSFLDIFRNGREYKWLNIAFVLFLRLCLWSRACYFIWSKKNEEFLKNQKLNNEFPYEGGKNQSKDVVYSKGDIIQMARQQAVLFGLFLGLLIGYALTPSLLKRMVLFVFSFWAMFVVFYFCLTLRKKWPGVYLFGMLIPIVQLIIPVILAWESDKILRVNNIEIETTDAKYDLLI